MIGFPLANWRWNSYVIDWIVLVKVKRIQFTTIVNVEILLGVILLQVPCAGQEGRLVLVTLLGQKEQKPSPNPKYACSHPVFFVQMTIPNLYIA